MKRYRLGLFALAGLAFAWAARTDAGGDTKSDSKVKASVEASKIADGKQTVTITLAIEKGWHLYANPVNHEFLEGGQTTVKILAKAKLKSVGVKYPAGKTVIDKKEKHDVYEGVVKIQANVQRAAGDTGPLEISIAVQACDAKTCLQPGTIKLMVP